SAGCGFHEYEGTGALYTSFACEPDMADSNLEIVRDVFAEVQKSGITEEELNQARSKILSLLVRRSERPMGRMGDVGMAWTYLGQYRSVDDDLQAFESVTPGQVREVLDQYPLSQVTTLALGPRDDVKPPRNGR